MHPTRHLCLALAITVSNSAHAEPNREYQLRYQVGVTALAGLPAGSDDAPSDTPGYGLELGGGAGLVGWPVTVGVDVRPLHWNETTRRLTLYIDEHPFPAELTRLEQTVTFSGWLRVHPEIWRFRPYVEAAAGIGGLIVKSSLYVQGANAPITVDDQAFQPSWGLGGGLDFLLARSITTTGEQAKTYATLGLRRTFGGDVIVDAATDLGPAHLRLSADTWVLSLGFTISVCDAC